MFINFEEIDKFVFSQDRVEADFSQERSGALLQTSNRTVFGLTIEEESLGYRNS